MQQEGQSVGPRRGGLAEVCAGQPRACPHPGGWLVTQPHSLV